VIGLFKQKSPGNLVILLLFGLLIKLPIFLFPRKAALLDGDGPLYRVVAENLPAEQPVLASLLAFALLYIQALMLTYLTNEYRMMSRQHYLTGMAYLLLTSLMPEWNELSAPLLAATGVIWTFVKLFRLYNLQNARPQVYNIGLIAGITSYVYFPSTLFLLCLLLGLMILKPFRFNEIILFLLGWLTPYYFHSIFLFLNDRLTLDAFLPQVRLQVPPLRNSIWLALSTLLLTIPFLLGGYFIQTQLRKLLIQVRKNWSILLLYLLLAFFVPFINNPTTLHAWVMTAAPFALFHACGYFYPVRPVLPNILFFLTIAYILYLQYGTPTWH
jgi:hypothetical protein